MRQLILETQVSVDGFIADRNSTTKPFVWNWGDDWPWDPPLRAYHTTLVESADVTLLSRQMIEDGFIKHWEEMAPRHDNPQSRFANHIKHTRKIVFSKTLKAVEGENTEIVSGDLATEISRLKSQPGKNLIVYGGARFVASIIEADLIDEYHFLINPCAIGTGLAIFKKLQASRPLKLIESTAYACGVVLTKYASQR